MQIVPVTIYAILLSHGGALQRPSNIQLIQLIIRAFDIITDFSLIRISITLLDHYAPFSFFFVLPHIYKYCRANIAEQITTMLFS